MGSQRLPFDSITIKPVKNITYEPRLEESLHQALSTEFIKQGIMVMKSGGDVELESTVTEFLLGAVGAVDEMVQEQELIMRVNLRLIEKERTTDFGSMQSPLKITFQSTGTVSQAAALKEEAIAKASLEISKEFVSRIIMRYAK